MLSEEQKNIIIKAMMPFKPLRIGVFGSFARNEDNEKSDIDLLYDFNSTYSLFDLSGLKIELQNLLNRNVDLVEFTAIHPSLKKSIIKDSVIFYGE